MTSLNHILKPGPLDHSTSNYYWNQLSEQSRVKQLLATMVSISGTSFQRPSKTPPLSPFLKQELRPNSFKMLSAVNEHCFYISFLFSLLLLNSLFAVGIPCIFYILLWLKLCMVPNLYLYFIYSFSFSFFFCVKHIELPRVWNVLYK